MMPAVCRPPIALPGGGLHLSLMTACFVRGLAQDDEPLLWEMLYHALYVAPGQPPFPRGIVNEPEIARYVLGWGRANDRGFVAFDEATSRPAGAAWARLFVADERGYGYINDETPELSAAVLPEYRNKGVGTALLNRLVEDARTRFPALSLSVSADNPAVRLYRRLGFRVVGQAGTSLVMEKRF
jgi:ribosomal protein S18 acetylase RimI-like enzyme